MRENKKDMKMRQDNITEDWKIERESKNEKLRKMVRIQENGTKRKKKEMKMNG